MVRLLDRLPGTVSQAPAAVWSVFARSLGEQGAGGRTALAWRWALTGDCPSPVRLSVPLDRLPSRRELAAEAEAKAELSGSGSDVGGQVMHARYVLQWLADDLDALPLWNGGPQYLHVTDGAAMARSAAEIEEVQSWAMLAQWRHPWPRDGSASPDAHAASGSARGVVELLDWVRGESTDGPLSGRKFVVGWPSLYQVSLEVCPAMAGLVEARLHGDEVTAGRMEAVMDTFVWLAGWTGEPPVDRHGHLLEEDCAERGVRCGCAKAGTCLRTACPACSRAQCAEGFG